MTAPREIFTGEEIPLPSPILNRIPEKINHIHLMGICGTGMASLAGILQNIGYHVTGSDQDVYPPMSHLLESLNIKVMKGYGSDNLNPSPDLVVVGNVITRANPEAMAMVAKNLPYVSFPQAIRNFALKGKKSVVISGTHGKTTTSSLAAWMLNCAGMDPGFMIGGIPANFQVNFRLGTGTFFVIEGDEYDTAFFDKGPKFLHYDPWGCIITSIEYDHADIYRDIDHVCDSFAKLISLIPGDGFLIANFDYARLKKEAVLALCPVHTYGLNGHSTWGADGIVTENGITSLRILRNGRIFTDLSTHLYGLHNISNLISVVALSQCLDVPVRAVKEAAMEFKGVKRRQELIGEAKGVTVLDDFAHHPTAVKETVAAVRGRYPLRRIIAVFEPRSNSSRRNVFQEQYSRSFSGADLVMIPRPSLLEKIPPADRFSSERLVEDLRKKGLSAYYFENTNGLLKTLTGEARSGDVVLFMSNGAFDHLPKRFFEIMAVSN
jgi:UDP-N-acetylmuramate: L-alanyl-gamma-D-glutamyl-meso-diaminopimelate ligase